MRRFIIPSILTIVLTVILAVLLDQLKFMPMLASQEGEATDTLLRVLFTMSAFFFSLVVSFLGYSLIVFRRRPGDTGDAQPIYGNTTLEIVWTAIPLLIVIALGGYGAAKYIEINRIPDQPELVVNVTGVQWAWSFYYPDADITSARLMMPVDRPIRFRLVSTDVIHSFWIPEFRIKMDAIPGVINELRLTPTQVGTYTVHCAELCGTAHAYMTSEAIVVPVEEFETWLAAQQEQQHAPGAADGAALIQQQGCLSCHSLDGSTMIGPTFKGLYQRQEKLEDGQTVTADDAYLHESIVDPGAKIVAGFPNVMPKDYGQKLDETQIQALIEYLKSVQ